MGGALAAIEAGYFQREIQEAAYQAQKAIESKEADRRRRERVHRRGGDPDPDDDDRPAVEPEQVARLARLPGAARRGEGGPPPRRTSWLRRRSGRNLMPPDRRGGRRKRHPRRDRRVAADGLRRPPGHRRALRPGSMRPDAPTGRPGARPDPRNPAARQAFIPGKTAARNDPRLCNSFRTARNAASRHPHRFRNVSSLCWSIDLTGLHLPECIPYGVRSSCGFARISTGESTGFCTALLGKAVSHADGTPSAPFRALLRGTGGSRPPPERPGRSSVGSAPRRARRPRRRPAPSRRRAAGSGSRGRRRGRRWPAS